MPRGRRSIVKTDEVAADAVVVEPNGAEPQLAVEAKPVSQKNYVVSIYYSFIDVTMIQVMRTYVVTTQTDNALKARAVANEYIARGVTIPLPDGQVRIIPPHAILGVQIMMVEELSAAR